MRPDPRIQSHRGGSVLKCDRPFASEDASSSTLQQPIQAVTTRIDSPTPLCYTTLVAPYATPAALSLNNHTDTTIGLHSPFFGPALATRCAKALTMLL